MLIRPDLAFCDDCQLTSIVCLQAGADFLSHLPTRDQCSASCRAHLQPSTPRSSPGPPPESSSSGKLLKSRALDASVLRTCRQIYNECHQLLYISNSFSFDNPFLFLRFLETIHTANLKQIRNLQLHVTCSLSEVWHGAEEQIRAMQGLRSLQLIVTTDISPAHYQEVIRDAHELHDIFSFPLSFRILPLLQTVRVAVQPIWNNSETLQARETIAQILRDKIADPNSAKAQVEEHEEREQAITREAEEAEAAKEEKRKKRKAKKAQKKEERQEQRPEKRLRYGR
ncbi:MAG: hypothetical protein Q9168_004136 [Polycauliona sp. 1 TL-2023]